MLLLKLLILLLKVDSCLETLLKKSTPLLITKTFLSQHTTMMLITIKDMFQEPPKLTSTILMMKITTIPLISMEQILAHGLLHKTTPTYQTKTTSLMTIPMYQTTQPMNQTTPPMHQTTYQTTQP